MGSSQSGEQGLEVYNPLESPEFYSPLDLGRTVLLDTGERVYGFVLETVFEKGVVRRLAEIVENASVGVRFIQFSSVKPQAGLMKAIVFLDFSNTSINPEEALRLVRKQPIVKNAHLIAPSPEGIVFDNYFFPLTVGGRRAVIFRRSVYESLFQGVREKFGTAGEAMLYYQGFNIGHRTCQIYKENTGLEEPEALAALGKAYFRTMGWGIIHVAKLNIKEGEACIRIYQSFECEVGKGSETPYGHFVRGILAGFFTNIFQREVKAVETKCIARGDPNCEYTINAHG